MSSYSGEEIRDSARWLAVSQKAGLLHRLFVPLSPPPPAPEQQPSHLQEPPTCPQTPTPAGGERR